MEAAARRLPDLVVIGETLDAGCPYSAARRICAARDIPVLVAARRGAHRPIPPADASLAGPFMLREIGHAVAEAEQPTMRTAAA